MFEGVQILFLACFGFTFIVAGMWGVFKRRRKQSLLIVVGLMCWGWLAIWLTDEASKYRTDSEGTYRIDGKTG